MHTLLPGMGTSLHPLMFEHKVKSHSGEKTFKARARETEFGDWQKERDELMCEWRRPRGLILGEWTERLWENMQRIERDESEREKDVWRWMEWCFSRRQEALSVGFLQTSRWSYKYCKLYVDRQTTETLGKERERSREDIRWYFTFLQ